MSKMSFAETINSIQVMTIGMQNNATEASTRGWQDTKSTQLAALRTEAIKLNDEQERLKADLKTKTAELNEQMKEAKKVVKLGFPQSQWKEFGVADKR